MLKRLIIIVCLLLNGCLVGPHYKEPLKKVDDHWIKQDASVKESAFVTEMWWEVFNDPTLTFLIYQGYHDNISLQIAGVRVLQARAQLAQSVGMLYPQQQGMMGNLTYNNIGGTQFQGLIPNSFTLDSLGFNANWEIDFWGKYRRAIQSNDANFLASFAAYDNALVTLTADIATAYIKIRTTEALIKTTKANIQVQQIAYKIARSRFKEGQTSQVDVEQAQTELSETESLLPSLINGLQRQKDVLAVLLGTTPACVEEWLQKKQGIPKAPSTVAVGIPIETITRRPDIYQARLEAMAQLAAVGVAEANLLPAVSLSGTFAFSSNNIGTNSLGDLFQSSHRTITAGPSFFWPLLNYGQITNVVRVKDAIFQQALLNYQNQVLKAQQEVQDGITSYIESKKAVQYLVQANYAATKTLKLTLTRYREGETDFTPVLNAEQQQLRIQTSLINAQGDTPQALVALYRALGGGWKIRGCNDIVPKAIKAEMAGRTQWGSLLQRKNHMPPATKKDQLKERYLPKW